LIKRIRDSRQMLKRSRGFTLVELMTVAWIISILAAMSFALISRMRMQAAETNGLAALNVLATGYEMYYYYHREYPQWGPDQPFASSAAIIEHLADEEFIPRSFKNYSLYDPDKNLIYGITGEYALEIPVFNPADPTTYPTSSYFIILRPLNFQKDSLAIGQNPYFLSIEDGWVAARPRRGRDDQNYRTYDLFVFKRLSATN